VLAGAIFGDHCSPLSDTTILSSMASGSDHVDHVRTQMPYALTVAVVAVLLGDLPSAFGFPPWISLVAGVGVLYAILRLLGRPVPEGQG
jgi:Na+/H+ antiporter NhaC